MAITSSLGRTRPPSDDDDDLYPSSDGKPMAETDRHVREIARTVTTLQVRYQHRDDVYVAGNNFLYYEQGNPRAVVSPDTYVVFGAENRTRNSYKTWEAGDHLPSVIFEFTSKKTRREDTDTKRPLYERLRIPEYFLFDPTGDYLRPRLQGYRLEGDAYIPLELVNGRLHSVELHLDLVVDGDEMRLFDPQTGEFLRNLSESETERLLERERAEQEKQRARDAETERLLERARAERAEAELLQLRAELEARRQGRQS